MLAKQSTVLTVVVGPILDSTGAEYASAVIGDLSISKNGGTLTAMASAATLTYIANGMYTLVTTTGNMDTLGAVQVTCNKATYQMPKMERNVVPASVYDAIIANATNATGGLPTATGTITALAGAVSTLTAGGVRTELATELGRIDATIGSRATPTNITQASGVTLAPTTGLGNQTANITGNLSGSVGSVTGAVGSVTSPVAVSDKTGFKLASDGLALVTAWTVGITGNLTGNVTGSVGSVTSGVTVSDKTGFSLLAGTGLGAQNGSVALVTKVEELGANALTANGAVDAIPTAVWNALLASYTTANTFGARVVRSLNSNNTVQITGSHHAAAVLHDAEPNSIPEDAFVSGALSARALAADAATEIATAVAGIQALSRLDSMIESDGAGQFRFDTIALEQAPAGGGGGGTDWTANERTAIRAIFGIPISGTTPTDPSSGILDEIRDQTALLTSGGTVYVTSPVTSTGQLASPLIIGDDYLAANGRRFRWTVALPPGYVIATSTARFGMRYEDEQGLNTFVATGTVTDAGSGNVHLDFDVAKTVTGTLRPGWYQWSVEIVSATGVEITQVKSGKNVEWQDKQT
jgi:hypothetical protein